MTNDIMWSSVHHKNTHPHTGTKNVAKKMKKVSCGTKKTQGKTWFPELSDKCKQKFMLASHTESAKLPPVQVKVPKFTCTTV